MNPRLLVVLLGAAAGAWSISRWRQAVQVAMVLLVLEGALRKWLLPGAQDLIYFAKDVFLLGAYIGFFAERERLAHRLVQVPPLFAALGVAAAWGALQVFNPALPNVLVGLLGFKAYFFYVPLLWVLPAAFDSDADLARFLRRYIWLAIPVGMLAAAQFLSPSSSALNTYARQAPGQISTFGSSTYVRVTATFSYITGYVTYVSAMVFMVLGVLATTRWRLRGNWLILGALAMTVLGMLMSGSRGPILMLLLLTPIYAWLTVARDHKGGATFARILLVVALVAGFLGFAASDAVEAFYGRAVGYSDLPSRVVSPLIQPLRAFEVAGFLGVGIGATHQTAVAVAGNIVPYSWLPGIFMEDETGRVMLELGGLGFLLIYFIRVYLIFYAFQQVMQLKTLFHRSLATTSLLFFLAQLPGAVVFNVTADVYYWFFAGLLLLAVRLDREVVQRQRQAARAARAAALEERRPRRPVLGPAAPGSATG